MQKNYQKVSVTRFIERFFIFSTVCFAFLISAFILCHSANAAIRPVVIRGEVAPGFDGDFKFEGFGKIAINNSGQVTFTADVMSGSTYYRAIWIKKSETAELIAAAGQEASGISGDDHFTHFDSPIINDAGQVLFFGTIDANENRNGVWKGTPGSLSLVVREGDAAPGVAGYTFNHVSLPSNLCFNNSGQVAFQNGVRNAISGLSQYGIWQETASGLTKVVMTGDEAPGFAASGSSVEATYINIYRPLLNNNALVFSTDIGVPWPDALNWTYHAGAPLIQQKTIGGSITTKYKGWTAAPGVSGEELYSFQNISRNASDQLVFKAMTFDAENQVIKNGGIWSDVSGSLALVALDRSHAPGTPSGAVFDIFSSGNLAISDSGHVAFIGSLLTGTGGVDSSNNTGIWIETNGVLELIARAGDSAPGTPEGTIFGRLGTAPYGFNSAGQFCFSSFLIGPSGNYAGDSIWLYDPADGISLIVSSSDQVTLTTGETVTFSGIYHMGNGSGGSDGYARVFSNNGEIAFSANLSDGRQGFFIANTDSSNSSDPDYNIPDKITLTSPTDTTEDTTPNFIWNEDPASTWYKLFIWDSSQNKVHDQWYRTSDVCSGGICTVTLSSELADDNYEWWVRGWNDDGNGPWSTGMNFTVQGNDSPPSKVILTSPSGTIEDTTPAFTWNENPASTWYKLFIWDSSQNKVHDQWYKSSDICSGGICTATLSSELPGDSYQWWARGWNDVGNGPWSTGMNFTVQGNDSLPSKVILTSPSGTIEDTTPTFNWNETPASTWYKLFIWDSSQNKVHDQWYRTSDVCSGGICTVTLSSELADDNYEWWVRGWNDFGNGDWSDGMSFTVSD